VEIALDGHFEMRAEFMVEVHIKAVPAKQGEDTGSEGAEFHFVPFDGQQEEPLAEIARLLLAVNGCAWQRLALSLPLENLLDFSANCA
jgi:hypothetical protein